MTDPTALDNQLSQLEQEQFARDLGALSRRVRKRPLVLFFGRATFSDNTKYLYLRALAEPRDYEVYWCSADDELVNQLRAAGLPCLHLGEQVDVSIDLLLHAAVAVFCVNPNESVRGMFPLVSCLDGARKIQLWHGVSVKRLTLQLVSYLGVREQALRRPWEFSSRADHVLSTASCLDPFWREVFGCRNLLRAGYPRNEVILRPADAHEMIGADIGAEAADALVQGRRRALLVVPTWQRNDPTWLSGTDFIARLLRHARRRGFDLYLKIHPTFARTDAIESARRTEGLYLLHPGADVYPWLPRFDGLLTDYSSMMFDFLLSGKPVLRLDMPPGCHQDFEPDFSLIPDGAFAHVFTRDDLEARVDRAFGADDLRDARAAMAARLFETDPLQAAAQLMRRIDRMVAEATADDFRVELLD